MLRDLSQIDKDTLKNAFDACKSLQPEGGPGGHHGGPGGPGHRGGPGCDDHLAPGDGGSGSGSSGDGQAPPSTDAPSTDPGATNSSFHYAA